MAGGNGAMVYKNGFCPIYTGEYGTALFGSPGIGFLFTEDSRLIINGNIMKRICHGHLTENFPSEAVRYGSAIGEVPFGYGADADAWQVVITPSGEATLTARKSVV